MTIPCGSEDDPAIRHNHVVLADLVRLLLECGVLTLQERGVEDDVAAGRCDVRLDELTWDSLGLMEFCIALEDGWGVSITPDELAQVGTLQQLASRLGG